MEFTWIFIVFPSNVSVPTTLEITFSLGTCRKNQGFASLLKPQMYEHFYTTWFYMYFYHKNSYVFLMVLLSIFGSEMAPKWHQKVIRKVHWCICPHELILGLQRHVFGTNLVTQDGIWTPILGAGDDILGPFSSRGTFLVQLWTLKPELESVLQAFKSIWAQEARF